MVAKAKFPFVKNLLCAARVIGAKSKFSPRCARQIPEKTGDLAWHCQNLFRAARNKVAKAKNFFPLRAPDTRESG